MADENRPCCSRCKALGFLGRDSRCQHDAPGPDGWTGIGTPDDLICYQFVDLDNRPWNEIVRDPKYLTPAVQKPKWKPPYIGAIQPEGTELDLSDDPTGVFGGSGR